MTQQEFETRSTVKVSANEFEAINAVYMASDVDKDTFCSMWRVINKSRVQAAKEQAKRKAKIDKIASMVMRNIEWTDVKYYNIIAATMLTEKEQALLASVGIEMQSEPNDEGFRHYKRFGDLRQEIHELLKTA